eukprot:360891_1
MRTLVFILLTLLSISNARDRCPSHQCCLSTSLGPCPTTPSPTGTPSPTSRGECLEDIYDDCLHIYFIFFCSGASIGLISGIVSHKYCNCGKYCSKENSNANDQNDIGMQKYDE